MLNAHDHSLIERDAALTGLRYLLDTACLRELFEQSLAAAVPEGLRVSYLRYKPGVNCTARLDTESGLAYAKAFALDVAGKLQKARQRPAVAGPHGVGRVCLDHAGIMLSFFPNDIALPSVTCLADPATRPRFLERIFKADPTWSEASYTPLNYKPERRFVARLTRPDGRHASIKFYSKKEFKAIRSSRKSFKRPPGLPISSWIGGSKSHRVMAYSWLPGVTLNSRLEAGHCEEAYLAGEAIARLHLNPQPALGQRGPGDLATILASLGKQLGYLIPDLARKADELAVGLGRWLQERDRQSRIIHGDFYDKQVVIQDGSVGIIDSDRMQMGDPGLDLGCFMAHLERRRIEGALTPEQVNKTGSALLEGYRDASPAGLHPRDIHAFTAVSLFQLSHHPFRDRRTDWAEQTHALLARCDELFTDRG